MYSFTNFAMQLNEMRGDMEGVIPQTDCRRRPDIRAMENGDIGNNRSQENKKINKNTLTASESPQCYIFQTDLASEEKKRLEEKQRAARKNRSKSDEEWKTR